MRPSIITWQILLKNHVKSSLSHLFPFLAQLTIKLLFNEIIQYYNDVPSIIIRLRENLNFIQLRDNFKFKHFPESDIYKLLKNIDDRKSTLIYRKSVLN